MHERTNIQLSAADRRELEAVAFGNRNSPQKHVWRAKIVLLTADDHGTAEIMRATGKAKTVIWRWQERFGEKGAGGALARQDEAGLSHRRCPPASPAWGEDWVPALQSTRTPLSFSATTGHQHFDPTPMLDRPGGRLAVRLQAHEGTFIAAEDLSQLRLG